MYNTQILERFINLATLLIKKKFFRHLYLRHIFSRHYIFYIIAQKYIATIYSMSRGKLNGAAHKNRFSCYFHASYEGTIPADRCRKISFYGHFCNSYPRIFRKLSFR